MRYQAPVFVEVKMDAEIGSYQQDEQNPGELPYFAKADGNLEETE
jgi:hypothetical protein